MKACQPTQEASRVFSNSAAFMGCKAEHRGTKRIGWHRPQQMRPGGARPRSSESYSPLSSNLLSPYQPDFQKENSILRSSPPHLRFTPQRLPIPLPPPTPELQLTTREILICRFCVCFSVLFRPPIDTISVFNHL